MGSSSRWLSIRLWTTFNNTMNGWPGSSSFASSMVCVTPKSRRPWVCPNGLSSAPGRKPGTTCFQYSPRPGLEKKMSCERRRLDGIGVLRLRQIVDDQWHAGKSWGPRPFNPGR